MTDFKQIYLHQADRYEALVAREDHAQNLPRALDQIYPWRGADVIELGAGTGRVTMLYAPAAKSIHLFDASRPMLDVAVAKLRKANRSHWLASVADNRQLPVSDGVADVSIAGWSFGHFTGWYPSTWQVEIEQAIEQLRRVLRPDGVMIIIETLGTGHESPLAPSDALAAYYQLLEQDYGFSSTWIRMDFRFESSVEAAALLGFFFGDELADHVVRASLTVLPECTGLWWRRK